MDGRYEAAAGGIGGGGGGGGGYGAAAPASSSYIHQPPHAPSPSRWSAMSPTSVTVILNLKEINNHVIAMHDQQP